MTGACSTPSKRSYITQADAEEQVWKINSRCGPEDEQHQQESYLCFCGQWHTRNKAKARRWRTRKDNFKEGLRRARGNEQMQREVADEYHRSNPHFTAEMDAVLLTDYPNRKFRADHPELTGTAIDTRRKWLRRQQT